MNNPAILKGFSKISRKEKISLISGYVSDPEKFISEISNFDHPDKEIQEKLNSFSENTLANFPLPFGVAPNFLINGKSFILPMVIEESSVVAAASSASRFWHSRGGFVAEVKEMKKTGQIHFIWKDNPEKLIYNFDSLKNFILQNLRHLTQKMEDRGGGITDIQLIDKTGNLDKVYQLRFTFNTADSMGANFINSVLEEAAELVEQYFDPGENGGSSPVEVLMAILSNYTPECLVTVELRAEVKDLDDVHPSFSGSEFARRFVQAVHIAENDIYRAVTHNKGIFNGIDAVLIATGNDYRAVEAGGHAYASRSGYYQSLSSADVSEGEFLHRLEVPVALGTVGGLTRLHPLARWSFDLLGEPGAKELMMIAGSAGLANNFSALRSLVTVGIQRGHMKMHLENILTFLNADEKEKVLVREEFQNKTISHSNVELFLNKIRSSK